MPIDIDKSRALSVLNDSFVRCSDSPISACKISNTINFILSGHNCLTYRYIMLTALVAKATNDRIDILSLQASDESAGAYDARSLCSKVVFPFQRDCLGNAMGGSNSDPLVNKPGRFPRLRPSNPTQGGDPQKALAMLCNNLPKIETSDEARECVDYIISRLLEMAHRQSEWTISFSSSVSKRTASDAYKFLSMLISRGFGGAALVIATTTLYRMQYSEPRFSVVPHPTNQSGKSSRQFSDLDVLRDGVPWIGTECKDKPYTASDVEHAADTALEAGASALRFIAGRQASFQAPPAYFADAREKYALQGILIGVATIDDLLDLTFTEHADCIKAADVYADVLQTAKDINAIEAQMWIYKNTIDI